MGAVFRETMGEPHEFFERTLDDFSDLAQERWKRELHVIPNEDSKLMKFLGWFWRFWGRKDWFESTSMAWWLTFFFVHRTPTIFMPKAWFGTAQGAYTVSHETVHLNDMRRLSLPVFLFLYLLCLPFGISMRAAFELKAYMAEIMLRLLYEGPQAAVDRAHFVYNALTGGMYVYAELRKKRLLGKLANGLQQMRVTELKLEEALAEERYQERKEEHFNWQNPARDLSRPAGSA